MTRLATGRLSNWARHMCSAVFLAGLSCVLVACPCGRGSKQLGERCDGHTACANAMCIANVCSVTCTTDTDCVGAKVKMVCAGNTKTDTNPEGHGKCQVP